MIGLQDLFGFCRKIEPSLAVGLGDEVARSGVPIPISAI
jgi:hypothetical protein